MLGGRLEGDPALLVSRLTKIEEGCVGGLTFLSNPKYESFLYETEASVVVVNEDLALSRPVRPALIRVKNAYAAFSELLTVYHRLRNEKSGREEPVYVHESAVLGIGLYIGAFSYIGKGAEIGDRVKIHPQVYIGDSVRIGDDSVLYPGVKVYDGCTVGRNVILHSGAVIGSDGFGFAPQADGRYAKVPQVGNVIVEDDVEIGANTVVDRATLSSTIIRRGVKLDNLIQVAHNVEIGADTVVAAQTGISGSTKVGERVVLGGQVGIVGHIRIADGSQVQGKSGITSPITEENRKWAGTPATPYGSQMRSQVLYNKLPLLEQRIAALEEKLKNLES